MDCHSLLSAALIASFTAVASFAAPAAAQDPAAVGNHGDPALVGNSGSGFRSSAGGRAGSQTPPAQANTVQTGDRSVREFEAMLRLAQSRLDGTGDNGNTARASNEDDVEARMFDGAKDAEAAMQNLEDMLLPVLQDVKRGFDTRLHQRARSR